MASLLNVEAVVASYCGIASIFEYTNDDGKFWRTNCGQAAACTFLTFHGKLAPGADLAKRIMTRIERAHPPDNVGGYLGTSRRCVQRICRAFNVRTRDIAGEAPLRHHLSRGDPVIVMLGVPGGRFLRWELPAGHWMVAYGFDDQHVYLTNQGKMTWDDFRKGWNALVPRLISMRGKGIVALQPRAQA